MGFKITAVLVTALMALAVSTPLAESAPNSSACDSDMQLVMCGQIPFEETEARQMCCRANEPVPAEQLAVAAATTAAAAKAMAAEQLHGDAAALIASGVITFTPAMRTDLVKAQRSAKKLNYYLGTCLTDAQVQVPTFRTLSNSTTYSIVTQTVPQLPTNVITAVKSAANSRWPWSLKAAYNRIVRTSSSSGFIHPAGYAGPAELALLQYRLGVAAKIQRRAKRQPPAQDTASQTEQLQQQKNPITEAALVGMITGANVAPKVYPGPWWPPVDCSPTNYTGPYPMTKVEARYGGMNQNAAACPANYPVGAPKDSCAHVSFIELDGQMSYKQALAYWATGDIRHAQTAMRILDGWASVNKEWGLQRENGPLEAGWGCAAMSRSMELLKTSRWTGFNTVSYNKFVSWINSVLMPQMDYYVDVMTSGWVQGGVQNLYGNWHSTIADCYVAFGLLTDDRTRYQKGVNLYKLTLQDYLRWGRGSFAQNRIIGEATETLRDIYHTEFGLGGLIQVAESAWQQNEDLYSVGGYALAASLELHARMINAYNRTELLPPGFKFYADMPAPPAGSAWQFDIRTQLWYAKQIGTGKIIKTQDDGIKYLVEVKWLPTSWEIAYNHFAGRLGMDLPETAKLLRKYWPEYYEFHWGQGTLTHADTAQLLWQAGVNQTTVCGKTN